jgi:mono/diheme cytochrome c family protein
MARPAVLRSSFPETDPMVRRILLVLSGLILIVVGAAAAYIASRQHLTFDAPYPDVTASTDSAVIARGRYVVRNLAHCAGCHGDPAMRATADADAPLSGGYVFDIPPGRFYARNLTPDPETGLGNVPDKAIARALRYGVGHDGRALLPFMEMQGLSDEDLEAVVSWLRTQAPVRNSVPPHYYSLLGKIVKATVLSKPVGPAETPLARTPHGATMDNGRYLVESVALCWGCHTQRSEKTGALTGPRFGGATGFAGDDPTRSWSPPNITSDPATGRLGRMTEDEFVTRFRAGELIAGSPMPWRSFSQLDEDDLRAIYRYLKSVPPVKNDVGPADVEKAAG